MVILPLDDVYSKALIHDLCLYGLDKNDLIIKAMHFAKYHHHGKSKASGELYYMHPIAVARKILIHKQEETIISAAILHDVLEDTKVTVEIIEKEFNIRIAQIVYRLTRIIKGEKISTERLLEESYLAKDTDAILIKIYDRLHNIETLGYMTKDKQKKKIIETIESVLPAIIYLEDRVLEERVLLVLHKSSRIVDLKLSKARSNFLQYISLSNYQFKSLGNSCLFFSPDK